MGLYQGVLESADGGAFVNLRDAAGNGITSTTVSAKQALDVNIASGTIMIGATDEAAFTYGTSTYQPIGGVYSTSITNLTTGQGGVANLTAFRDLRVNLRTSAGVELGNSSGDALWVQDTNAAAILALMSSATGTITTPTITTSSSTALASNSARKGFSIFNPTAFSVYLAFAATASTSSFTTLVRPNQYLEEVGERVYTGIVTMISTSGATGTLAVTELT
jgi:hypothetical protein